MCHKGVCMMFIPIRVGCIVGAALFVIYHIINISSCIKSLQYIDDLHIDLTSFPIATCTIFIIVDFVCIIFNGLMCYGIYMGNPRLVKINFIVGLTVTVVKVIFTSSVRKTIYARIIFFLYLAIGDPLLDLAFDSLFLVLVYHTHQQVSKTQNSPIGTSPGQIVE